MVVLVCRRVPFAPSVWASLLERVIDGAASELLFREAEMVSVGTKYETFLAAEGGVGNYLALLYPPFCAAEGTQCAVCRQSAAEFFFKWVDARLINRFKGGCKLASTNTSRGAECVSTPPTHLHSLYHTLETRVCGCQICDIYCSHCFPVRITSSAEHFCKAPPTSYGAICGILHGGRRLACPT